jgi:ABC-type arginine transport system ATPase subunit
MPIKSVEINAYYAFKGKFTADFCPMENALGGVNIFIGGNGTGKTTLLKALYQTPVDNNFDVPSQTLVNLSETESAEVIPAVAIKHEKISNCVYIPEKDILEHARGLLAFIEQKRTGFDEIYRRLLVIAQDTATEKQSKTQKELGQKIAAVVGGHVEWEQGDGTFYVIKTDGNRIPFAHEASGYKKLGFLGLLLACGQLERGTVLFWDEPENSLNPEILPLLVDILLELAQSGVQIFFATHDYNLARYFDVRKNKNLPVLFHNFSKGENGHISCVSSDEYVKIPHNLLESASADLFKAVVADALEVGDE